MNTDPQNELTPLAQLSEAEKRQRRARSIALALALGALVILFYAVTIAKLGANAIASHI